MIISSSSENDLSAILNFMNEISQNFIVESREFLSAKYLPKIEKCLGQLSDEDIWWRAGEESKR